MYTHFHVWHMDMRHATHMGMPCAWRGRVLHLPTCETKAVRLRCAPRQRRRVHVRRGAGPGGGGRRGHPTAKNTPPPKAKRNSPQPTTNQHQDRTQDAGSLARDARSQSVCPCVAYTQPSKSQLSGDPQRHFEPRVTRRRADHEHELPCDEPPATPRPNRCIPDGKVACA